MALRSNGFEPDNRGEENTPPARKDGLSDIMNHVLCNPVLRVGVICAPVALVVSFAAYAAGYTAFAGTLLLDGGSMFMGAAIGSWIGPLFRWCRGAIMK
jgi:hypothetical protein